MDEILDILLTNQDFRDKAKKELKIYELWFNENKEKCLLELEHLVLRTLGYENWKMDYSKESLLGLGKWLKENLETRKISEEEYAKVRANVPDYIDVSDRILTLESRTILLDAGIYFGEVFIHNHKGLKCDQYFSSAKNRDINHGNMVISLKKGDLNPIRIMFTMGSLLSKGKKDDKALVNIYEVWEEYL
ncbi:MULTISPECIES: hypothetical protein [unclassified Apibacter]|uniref:hypothetical protein n=1 Tax=unclassified Apibacter TaxID=2630820 RepID=UPI00135E0597|nr:MULTISPECIES: hypothetical protein [unclassified Apibacter]MXP05565.1 hypothetical protein [Apibacter sp. B3546]MXP12530.1 hypothetical protein [Apibacter sp. B3239]